MEDIKNIKDMNLLNELYDKYNSNKSIVIEILKNPNTDTNLLEKIFNKFNKNKIIIFEIIKNLNSTENLLSEIFDLHRNNIEITIKIIKNPNSTENLLSKIFDFHKNNIEIVIEIIKNPNITQKLLKKILYLYDYSKKTIIKIINSPNITLDLLNEISKRYSQYEDIMKLINDIREKLNNQKNKINEKIIDINIPNNSELMKEVSIIPENIPQIIENENKQETQEILKQPIENVEIIDENSDIAEVVPQIITEFIPNNIELSENNQSIIENTITEEIKPNEIITDEIKPEITISKTIEIENTEETLILNQTIENIEIIDENSDISEIVSQITTEFIPNNIELSENNQSIIENTITEEIKTNEIITDEIKPETAIPKTVEIIEIPNELQKNEPIIKAVKKDDSVKNKKEKEISNKKQIVSDEINDEIEYNLEKAEIESDNNIIYKYYEKYKRDPKVKEQAKKRANGVCECCGEKGFEMMNGESYLEVHHIEYLSENGRDNINNVCAVCATCHKKLHFSIDKEDLKAKIKEKIKNR